MTSFGTGGQQIWNSDIARISFQILPNYASSKGPYQQHFYKLKAELIQLMLYLLLLIRITCFPVLPVLKCLELLLPLLVAISIITIKYLFWFSDELFAGVGRGFQPSQTLKLLSGYFGKIK